jgi:hypothetical protein
MIFFTTIMITNCFEHIKSGLACKNKQGSISMEFKEIFHYMLKTRDNKDYNVGLRFPQGFFQQEHIYDLI